MCICSQRICSDKAAQSLAGQAILPEEDQGEEIIGLCVCGIERSEYKAEEHDSCCAWSRGNREGTEARCWVEPCVDLG